MGIESCRPYGVAEFYDESQHLKLAVLGKIRSWSGRIDAVIGRVRQVFTYKDSDVATLLLSDDSGAVFLCTESLTRLYQTSGGLLEDHKIKVTDLIATTTQFAGELDDLKLLLKHLTDHASTIVTLRSTNSSIFELK